MGLLYNQNTNKIQECFIVSLDSLGSLKVWTIFQTPQLPLPKLFLRWRVSSVPILRRPGFGRLLFGLLRARWLLLRFPLLLLTLVTLLLSLIPLLRPVFFDTFFLLCFF